MIGFVARFVLCGAICTGISIVIVWLTVPIMRSPTWTYMGAALFGAWVLIGLPLTWLWLYRWFEENAKR